MDHSWGYGSECRLRNENQDSFGVFEFPDFTLAIVCDGMGGHVGGAQASSLAVRTVHDTLRDADLSDIPTALEKALQAANQAIYEAARKNHRLMGMGTTAVVAALTDSVVYFAHVGDSRAYLVRNGTVRQMTRDHTMVNLFVDAELLTPEDAATHPEAHVLSRSLGVERQVDVEVSSPVPIEPEDVIFLCSDGVHGVLTDWEIANVDWGAPHEGVRHILDIVIAREGDDNASAVAVLCATSFEDVPPTPVPDPKRFEDSVAESGLVSGVTAVPLEEDSTPSYLEDVEPQPLSGPAPIQMGGSSTQTPGGPPSPADDGKSYVVFEDEEAAKQKHTPVPDLRKKPAETSNKGRLAVVGGLAIASLLCAGLGLGIAFLGSESGSGADPIAEAPSQAGEPVAMVAISGDEALVHEPVPHLAPEDSPPEAPPVLEEERPLFAPVLPETPRRLPHRPLRYTQPPPGGPTQWEAVQYARAHDCERALDAVAKGMGLSVDHATLYSQAWFCFNEIDQRPLIEARVERWEDFTFLLPHFEGAPEDRQAIEDDETRKLPHWYRPAIGGIEYRLEAFQRSTREDRLAEVIADLLGEPTVADHLAHDLLLEALAAEGLSRLDEPNERVIEWWARRVYVVTAAMNGRVGRLLETHRPEVVPLIRELLEAATTPRPLPPPSEDDEAPPDPIPVPAPVLQAREVALGLAPPPTVAKAVVKPKPVVPQEPDLSAYDDGTEGVKIYRKN